MNDEAVKWLREQIGVKLAAARGLACTGTGHWGVTCNDDFDYTIADTSEVLPKANPVADCWGEAVAYFITSNDPQDVIARCEAELAILDEHAHCEPCPTVSLLASGYKHREGYAEHWG